MLKKTYKLAYNEEYDRKEEEVESDEDNKYVFRKILFPVLVDHCSDRYFFFRKAEPLELPQGEMFEEALRAVKYFSCKFYLPPSY